MIYDDWNEKNKNFIKEYVKYIKSHFFWENEVHI